MTTVLSVRALGKDDWRAVAVDLNADHAIAQWLATAYLLASAPPFPAPAGRPTASVCVTPKSVSWRFPWWDPGIYVTAQTMHQLIACRVVQGLGGAALAALASAHCARVQARG